MFGFEKFKEKYTKKKKENRKKNLYILKIYTFFTIFHIKTKYTKVVFFF